MEIKIIFVFSKLFSLIGKQFIQVRNVNVNFTDSYLNNRK